MSPPTATVTGSSEQVDAPSRRSGGRARGGSGGTRARKAARDAEAGTGRRGRRARRRAAGPKRSFLWRWRRFFFLSFVFLIAAGSGLAFAVWQGTPLPPSEPPLPQTTFICGTEAVACDENNSMAQLSSGVDRTLVKFDDIPPVVVQAVIATEDKDYFDHKGVDPSGVARAFLSQVRDDDLQQGGSTITQQYVKNTYLSQERTLDRKLKEAVLAIKLERELDKKEILTRYLNTIFFGRNAYGVHAAAKAYFGKEVSQLGLPEAAYLAGIIRAPEAADANRPATDPNAASGRQAAEKRRRDVLNAMLGAGYITADQHEQVDKMGFDYVIARQATRNLGNVKYSDIGSEYVIDYVRHQLSTKGHFTDAQIFGGGLRVYTTIDWGMQKAGYDAIKATLPLPSDPSASIVALDNVGRVKVMVGGRDYKASQVNLAVGKEGGGGGRQPGSSFKPFALAEALRQNTPLTKEYDAPAKKDFKLADGSTWKVANYDDAGLGRLNLVESTKQSSNTAYAQIIEDVGVQNVTSLARKMGITGSLPEVPSVVLGTGEVSVLDMASGYSTFMDGGEHVEPFVVSRVTDAEGNVLYEPDATRQRVLDPNVANTVGWVLNQVVESGTATNAKFGQPSAGKTGTTENYRDAWYVGYTCQITAAVWMGYPGPETKYMDNVHGLEIAGGTLPASVFQGFMGRVTQNIPSCPFNPPAGAPPSAGTSVSTQPGPIVPFPSFPPSTTIAPPRSSTTATTRPTASSSTSAAPRPPVTPPPSVTVPPSSSTTAPTVPIVPTP